MGGRSCFAEDYEKFHAQGRGAGHGSNYEPYLNIRDAKPYSTRTRLYLNRFGREFCLLSYSECLTLAQIE